MRAANVALAHDPVHAGMHRAVEDFAWALDAPIVSFDDAARCVAGPAAGDGGGGGGGGGRGGGGRVVRIACGPGPLARGCHRVSAAAGRAAAAALAGSDLVVVHSLYRAHAPWAARWARRHGARTWAIPHGCLDPWSLAQRGLAKRIWLELVGRRYLAGVDRVVFSSRRSLEKGAAWVPADRAIVVRWPVVAPAVADREGARRRCRERWGIPADARVLLFLGRLHTVKRPLETVAAFVAATAGAGPVAGGAAPPCHLVVAGMDGDLTAARVAAAAAVAGGAGRVHVVGRLDGGAVAEALVAADGFVSLSFQENFGYAAAEAMAAGLPVILSPGHDLAHEMPRGPGRLGAGGLACGWLLPDDSAAAAVEAIRGWAGADPLQLAAAGASGAAWAREELSRERFRDELCGLAGG